MAILRAFVHTIGVYLGNTFIHIQPGPCASQVKAIININACPFIQNIPVRIRPMKVLPFYHLCAGRKENAICHKV